MHSWREKIQINIKGNEAAPAVSYVLHYYSTTDQFNHYNTCSTFRMNSCAEIKLRASEDGQFLVIKSMNEEHNHEISQVCHKTLA